MAQPQHAKTYVNYISIFLFYTVCLKCILINRPIYFFSLNLMNIFTTLPLVTGMLDLNPVIFLIIS